jgi:hypothetical protein
MKKDSEDPTLTDPWSVAVEGASVAATSSGAEVAAVGSAVVVVPVAVRPDVL